EGELLALSGLALCRIYPTRGPAAGTKEEFRVDMGKGAKAAADALLAAVRILGLRAPDVYLSNDNGPPFALVFPGAVRLLVGRLAQRQPRRVAGRRRRRPRALGAAREEGARLGDDGARSVRRLGALSQRADAQARPGLRAKTQMTLALLVPVIASAVAL